MKKVIVVAALFLSAKPSFAQQSQLRQLTAKYAIPGLQLVCIKEGKEETLNLGTIAMGSNKKISSKTIFEAASLSKCVFSYIVLRLYDRGIISLDTPLIHYIGSYNRFDSTDPRYAKITARMVLRHTTGLPNWGDDKSARLLFTPDSVFSYSGEGFQYLQRVVEKLTDHSLNEIAAQEVFIPLGMTNSSYTWLEKFDTLAAFGNSKDAVNGHKKQLAAASLLTCAHDYALFLQALMTGAGLKPETSRMMFSKQSEGNWFNHRVTEANKHIWWGLGIGLQENETGLWAWHWGDNGDFKAFYIINPEKKEALVYFTHSSWGLHITTDILNAYLPKQTWWPTMWIGYEFYEKKNMLAFWSQLEKQGYNHAQKIARDLKQKDPAFLLPDSDVNDIANILLDKKMKKEAIAIFQYNLTEHPKNEDALEALKKLQGEKK